MRQDPRRRTQRRAQVAGAGRVILVGGGPGDPELLTLKGFQALADADVVDRVAPACVMDGGLPSQQVVLTTLAMIVTAGPPPELCSPAVTVIGAVAAFAAG